MERAPDHEHRHGQTVAVVEDDSSVNQAIRRLLEATGFRTRTFESCSAVLAQQADRIADCFVLDIHLQDMTGFELHRKLREAGSTAPIVMITAYDDPAHRRAAMEIGAVAYLTKPFSSDSLLEAVCRAIESAKP